MARHHLNADGEVDRVKTANLLIHSEVLDVQARFVLACQYWSSWDVLAFFKNLQDFEREQILHKYSTTNENLNLCEKNAVLWVQDYKEGIIIESRSWCYQYYNWNYVSLQSHLLDDLTKEELYIVLDNIMEKSSILRIYYFCLSRMNANHREDVLKRYPLTVVSFYLGVRKQRLFMDAVNKLENESGTSRAYLNGNSNAFDERCCAEIDYEIDEGLQLPLRKAFTSSKSMSVEERRSVTDEGLAPLAETALIACGEIAKNSIRHLRCLVRSNRRYGCQMVLHRNRIEKFKKERESSML
ncbi:hypothetical protein TNCV_3932131 [Trichonephila clavipes]|nr:hypothetical protein TNCV_3932131 [Trichonephila clavipes]